MKLVKFIVFAHPKKDCETTGDNFLVQDLKLNYAKENTENAIGLKFDKAEQISAFDNSFDIYLFNDTNGLPNVDSLFITNFINSFYASRDQNEYKIILHRNSNWNFSHFDLNTASLFSPFQDPLNYFKSLKENENWIYQSHKSTDVYGKELKQIAKAIIDKNKSDYEKAITSLNERFLDIQLRQCLLPFETRSPFDNDQDLLSAKKELQSQVRTKYKLFE